MSIAGIGSQGGGNLSQILSSLLSKLNTSTTTTTNDTTSSTTSDTATTAAADGGLTGSTKPTLSSMILGTLIGLQQQSGTTADDSSGDPVSKLFSAMDSDGDGAINQSELESYITAAGGTADEADTLYSQLASDSDSGISESDFASQAPPPPPSGGHRGPPPTGADAGASAGSDIVSALDTDSDGTVSKDELTSYLTANGDSDTDADTLFASLSSDGTASITANDIDDAIQNYAANAASNPYLSILNLLAATGGTETAGSNTVSVNA